MRFDVRNPVGVLLGSLEVKDLRLLESRQVRFCRALDPCFYGTGFHELEARAVDPSFASVTFRVDEWLTRPAIGKEGGYYPGRVDFILVWDGPSVVLRDISSFQEAPLKGDESPKALHKVAQPPTAAAIDSEWARSET